MKDLRLLIVRFCLFFFALVIVYFWILGIEFLLDMLLIPSWFGISVVLFFVCIFLLIDIEMECD